MEKETMVYQSNPLVESRRDFSLIETRLFYLGLRDIVPRLTEKKTNYIEPQKAFPTTTISASDLVELFGNKKYYSVLKDICRDFAKKTVEIKSTNESDFEVYPVFAMLKFSAEKGLTLAFNPFMIPWLLDLADKPFTKLPFEQIWALRSSYAIRILELVLQYQNTKEHTRTISIEDLKQYLGMKQDSYKGRNNTFKEKVILGSIKDINEKTAYKIDVETISKGRRITGFKFKLHLPAEIKKEKRAKQIADIGNLVQGIAEGKAMTPKEEKPTISDEQRAKNQKRLKELMGSIKSM